MFYSALKSQLKHSVHPAAFKATLSDLHTNPKAFPATKWHLINPVFLAEVGFSVACDMDNKK